MRSCCSGDRESATSSGRSQLVSLFGDRKNGWSFVSGSWLTWMLQPSGRDASRISNPQSHLSSWDASHGASVSPGRCEGIARFGSFFEGGSMEFEEVVRFVERSGSLSEGVPMIGRPIEDFWLPT